MDLSEEVKTSESQNEAAIEPSVHSDIKDERIAARRKRVQAKIEADRRAAMGEEPQEVSAFDFLIPAKIYTVV